MRRSKVHTLAMSMPSPMGTSRIRLEEAVSKLISVGMSLLIAVGSHWTVLKGHCQAQLLCDSVILQQGLPSTKVLQQLVDELLGVCRVLSRRSFMPELHPAAGTDTSPAACSVQESSSTYRTLVILQPPPGHSFSPESTKQPPARRIRVALECLCSGEQLLGHTCFLHAAGGQLPTDQEWYLLDTLCTGSCLDLQKVTCWVQMLVLSAWLRLPQSRHCQLTALPCGKSCSFRLRGASGLHCSIEMALAVQLGSSGACLSLE
ncbi:uncharacterized protein LOC121357464 [Pyrgilauda ruficollis]|uniref:uncharacterized protein LOC121357464 n=1 Tax=Pyrgilauda ruficollis TaxID=221976 RepID=UPI001B86A8A4|nr:uncharacterized protein LOC121357464 [Pyrgilauda ruficollis]